MAYTEELKNQLKEAIELEAYEKIAKEYLRIKKKVINSGDLCHDEAIKIALLICERKGLFDPRVL